MSNPHRATPEQWVQIERFVEECSYDSCLLELRDRLAAAEQRISELEGNSAKQEIREAEAFGLMPVIEPPQLSDEAVGALWDEPSQACARRIYRAGWDAAMAVQNLRRQDKDAERAAEPAAPAGSLVDRVCTAIVEHGDGETYTDEARAAIYEVANWLEQFEFVGAVHALRGEVKRG